MTSGRRIAVLFLLLGSLFVSHQSHAQSDGDDAYDPFADYSEFDENTDEEADIHFFRHGRFFTLGFAMGFRGFTDSLSRVYSSNPSYGLYMSYFFDLRSALQVSFLTGDHSFTHTALGDKVEGNVAFTFVSLDYKYYLNTQNITRGLADLNPYFFGGLSQVYRTDTVPGDIGEGRNATMGLNFGTGFEVPLNRKKSYFGVQFTYRYFNFKDENQGIYMPNAGEYSSTKRRGDSYDLLGVIGLNF